MLFDQNTNLSIKDLNANNSSIKIDNKTSKNVYGIKTSNTSLDIHNALSDASGNAVGKIELTNDGDGNVYGMYGTPENEITNAYAYDQGSANGEISIVNNGKGNVFGIFSGSAYNAISYSSAKDQTVSSIIKIKNTNSGNAFGMVGYDDVFHIYQDNYKDFGGLQQDFANISSKIIIANEGNGNAYGMVGSEIHISSLYNENIKTDTLINITNKGNHNAYGLYGATLAYGDDAGYNNKIILINEQDGNAYGIYTRSINPYTTENSDKTHITTELVNMGKGNIYGVYIDNNTFDAVYGYQGLTSYADDVKLHNLGIGTAVGTYNASNHGSITIDRENFTNTDTFDGKSTFYSNSNPA